MFLKRNKLFQSPLSDFYEVARKMLAFVFMFFNCVCFLVSLANEYLEISVCFEAV